MNTSRNRYAALSFLEHSYREGDEFLDHVITGDETVYQGLTVSRLACPFSDPPPPLKKFKHMFSHKNHDQHFLGQERYSFDRLVGLWKDH
jgi:hypothetical protein